MAAKDTRDRRIKVLRNLRNWMASSAPESLSDLDALDVAIQLMTDTSLSRYIKAVHAVQLRRNKYQRVKEAPQP